MLVDIVNIEENPKQVKETPSSLSEADFVI